MHFTLKCCTKVKQRYRRYSLARHKYILVFMLHITTCSVSVLHTVVVIVLYTYLLCFKYFRFYHSPISKFCGQQGSITLSKVNESKWSGIFVARSHLLPLWSCFITLRNILGLFVLSFRTKFDTFLLIQNYKYWKMYNRWG